MADVTVISYPNNVVNDIIPIADTDDSNSIINNIKIDTSLAIGEEYYEVTYKGEVVTLIITEECRYTPMDIVFINKEGAYQFFTFFKAKTDSIDIDKSTYESDNGQPIEGNHQYIDYNIQGKSKVTANTGFISEDYNDDIKQLLLSERVWIYDKDNDKYIPINNNQSSLVYKNRQKDKLINYEIEFGYSYNDVNNL